MSKTNQTVITCPNCHHEFDVQDVLSSQVEEEIKRKYQEQLKAEKARYDEQMSALNKAREEFEAAKEKENELFQERLDKKLKEEKEKLEQKTREEESRKERELKEKELRFKEEYKRKMADEQAEQFKALQEELNEKSERIKELNKSKAEIERLKREKEELKEATEAEALRKLNEQIILEKERIRKAEEEKNELRFKELQKQLEDQKKLTEEMKRKQEQGSMQLQGEVQELAIEEWLQSHFPLDTIEEIKKGARGGDCIQIVNTRVRQNCGKIYYESKRTKEFHPSWIEKFKQDMRDKDADVGVIVTEAMPSDFDRMGILDGVWVCTFEEFKGLCAVLRENMIQLSTAISSQENRGDKMHMLYDYLTSNTFRMQVEAIVEGFTQMKTDLESEKRSMQRIWKQRDKQIEKVLTNTVEMYGSIKGIAGNAIQDVQALELPGDEEEE